MHRIGLVFHVEPLAHLLHGVFYPAEFTGGGRGKHSSADGTRLFRAVHSYWHTDDVCHYLDNEGRLARYSTQSDQTFYGDALVDEAVYDFLRSERRGFDQSTE